MKIKNNKKIMINKNIKIGLLSVLILLTGLIFFLLYKEMNNPNYDEQKIPLYSYNNKGTVNYEVILKPNILYETNSLEEGKLYITEFIDHIKTTFNYEFTGDRTIGMEGTYDIVAKVKGFEVEKEEEVIIWEKSYALVPRKNFIINGMTKNIKEDIIIELEQYNNFVEQVIEASKIRCQTNLMVVMNINLKGSIDNNQIEESISPNIVIPLNTNMFQISGNTNIEKPEVIEETKQVQLPADKELVILYCVIIGVFVILFTLIIIFTEAITIIKDPYERLLNQIFKKHGDRLVALNSNLNAVEESVREVKSIEDLIKMADELGRPIMYKYSSECKEIDKFYITNEDEVYILNVKNMLEEIEAKKKNNEAEKLMDKVKKFKSESKDNKKESKIES